MKSLYNRIFKNNQIIYGNPFHVKQPVNMPNIRVAKGAEDADDGFERGETDSVREETGEIRTEDIIAKAREDAEMILRESEYEAARILENASREAAERVQAIEEEAWQRGYAEGSEAAQRQYEMLLQEAENCCATAQVEHDRMLACMEAEMVSLVLEVAKKVIGQEMAVNQENLLYLVKQAIGKCSVRNGITLKVSKEDYPYLSENKDRLMSMVEGAGEIEIKQDFSLKAGACIVETPFGNVDAGVETKIRNIEEAFKSLLGDAGFEEAEQENRL